MGVKFVCIGLAAGLLTLSAAALEPLPEFKAPLKKTESNREYTGALKFDPQNLAFSRGSKKVVLQQDGAICFYSGTRLLGKMSLFISTPFQKYQRKISLKKPGAKFDGKGMQIQEIRTSPDGVTFDGLIPWNAAGQPVLARTWKIDAKIQDGKVRIQVEYELPKDMKYQTDAGVFASFYGVQEFASGERTWLPEGKVKFYSRKGDPIEVKFKSEDDNFTLIPSGWRAWNMGGSHLRLDFVNTPGMAKLTIGVDLGKGFEEQQIKDAFEVMKVMDDLVVPVRGKNLIPNPYFAVRHRFVVLPNLADTGRDGCYSTDAKFGRYSWCKQGGGRFLANIPLDAGDYVFSFYAKGKSRVTLAVQSVGDGAAGSIQYLRTQVNSPGKWTRYELPFHQARERAVFMTVSYSQSLLIDGLQLEKGKKATAFEAPAVEAGETKPFFFKSGEDITLEFELSTLEKAVSGNGVVSIRNFFGETVFTQKFRFSAGAGQYPKIQFKPGRLPDGIYVVKLDYGPTAPEQFYRLAVMPFLKNTHQTAKAFALGYEGHREMQSQVWEPFLARLQAIGVASKAHCRAMTPEVQKAYYKYGVVPFDLGIDGRGDKRILELMFPNLKNLPEGHMWSYIRDKSKYFRVKGGGLLPHYKLMGGWSPEYRKKFIETVAKEIRRYPKYPAYYFASEGPHEVKDDEHYPDWFAAFKEAVKSVYPDAWVYDGGEPGMGVNSQVVYTEKLLRRFKGKVVSDFVNAHTYTKNLRELYPNFRGLVAMMKRTGEYADSKISLAEGMHFYPYHISRWNTEHVCWNGEGWKGGSPSYDLGWHEKLSAAYYARTWLIFLTEYHRLWCACSSASNTGNFIMDSNLTPRAFQKIPNTLGILLGNPKRYIGDFTFAPDTKCLVWEDEQGHPLAAVWNEDPAVDSGFKDAPKVKLNYSGAEFIDLMGVQRETPENGEFALSSFPLFIRAKKGDADAFTKALSAAVLDDPDRLPCHIGFEILPGSKVKLTLVNQVSRELKGTLTVFGKAHPFTIPRTSETSLVIGLPKAVRADKVDVIRIPYTCKIGSRTFSKVLAMPCFAVKKFTGDWNKIPVLSLTNKTNMNKTFSDRDFSVTYQVAWDEKKIYLRAKVKDDVFSPGSQPGYRWTCDILQVYFDTRCSAVRTGKEGYDDDDYEYGFMPTADGKGCEVWRALSPDIQLTLGIAAPKNNTLAKEIPAKFARTKDGYIYEAEFPANYLLPMKLENGYNFAFGLFAADRDKGKSTDKGLSNTSKSGVSCYNRPEIWPVAVLTE